MSGTSYQILHLYIIFVFYPKYVSKRKNVAISSNKSEKKYFVKIYIHKYIQKNLLSVKEITFFIKT